MSIEVSHLGHTYSYRHPVGWSGGDAHVREKLNKSLPASEYPVKRAEETAVRQALAGILSGGEAIAPESGRHVPGGRVESGEEEISGGPPSAPRDQILEEPGVSPAHDPDRILGEAGSEGLAGGDPDRILED